MISIYAKKVEVGGVSFLVEPVTVGAYIEYVKAKASWGSKESMEGVLLLRSTASYLDDRGNAHRLTSDQINGLPAFIAKKLIEVMGEIGELSSDGANKKAYKAFATLIEMHDRLNIGGDELKYLKTKKRELAMKYGPEVVDQAGESNLKDVLASISTGIRVFGSQSVDMPLHVFSDLMENLPKEGYLDV